MLNIPNVNKQIPTIGNWGAKLQLNI